MDDNIQLLLASLAFSVAIILGPLLILRRKLHTAPPGKLLASTKNPHRATVAAERLCKAHEVKLDGLEKITACLGFGVFVRRVGGYDSLISKELAEDFVLAFYPDEAECAKAMAELSAMEEAVAPYAKTDFTDEIDHH